MRKIRTALAGVGSCASSFAQLVAQCKGSNGNVSGLMHHRIGGYELSDVEIVAAFDVDVAKVGLDFSKAIHQYPTKAVSHIDVEPFGVTVEPGILDDGLYGKLGKCISPHPNTAEVDIATVADRLRQLGTDVLICLLPTGATADVQSYARAAARAGAGYINATPEPVAWDAELVREFETAGVPLLGDDLRSHFGATTLHTSLIGLMESRGLQVRNTYQLNVGGNTDFLNLSDPDRSQSKVVSKRRALNAAGIDASSVSAGPNGFVEYLGDTKVCFVRIEADSLLNSTVSLDVRLEVEDSPNASGVLASAVRITKVAADRSLRGVIDEVCPLLFKSPRVGAGEADGLQNFTDFIDSLDAGEVQTTTSEAV